jgi:hypothetical protein
LVMAIVRESPLTEATSNSEVDPSLNWKLINDDGDTSKHASVPPGPKPRPYRIGPRLSARTMASRALRILCTALVGLVALSVPMDVAAAANPSAQALIDDAYDNGSIDSSWSCDDALDALGQLPQQRRPGYFAALAEVEQHLRVRCADRRNAPAAPALYSAVAAPAYTEPTSPLLESDDYSVDATLTLLEPSSEVGGDDAYDAPWETVIVGMFAGVLIVVCGAAALGRVGLRLFSRS